MHLDSAVTITGNGDGQINVGADQAGAHTVMASGSGVGTAEAPLVTRIPWLQVGAGEGRVCIHDLSDLDLQTVSLSRGSIGIASGGSLNFQTLEASTAVALGAAGAITGAKASSGAALDIHAAGAMPATVQAGRDIRLDGYAVSFGSRHAGRNLAVWSATDLVGATLQAGAALTLNGGDALTLDAAQAGADATLDAGVLRLGHLTAGRDVRLATDDLRFDNIAAARNLAIDSAQSIAGREIRAGGTMSLQAGTTIAVSTLNAASTLDLPAAALEVDCMSATSVSASSVDVGAQRIRVPRLRRGAHPRPAAPIRALRGSGTRLAIRSFGPCQPDAWAHAQDRSPRPARLARHGAHFLGLPERHPSSVPVCGKQ